MGVVVNGPWPMSQSFNIQNEISGNLEKCYNSESSSSGGNGAAALNSQWLKKIKLVKRIKRKIGIGKLSFYSFFLFFTLISISNNIFVLLLSSFLIHL